MIETTNQIHLDWEDIEAHANVLAEMIKNFIPHYKECEIVTIARGGLVPATIIAHRLGIKNITVWKEGMCSKSMPDEDKKILFIDDILDTGKTFDQMRDVLFNYNAKFCFLIKKQTGKKFDFVIKDMPSVFYAGVVPDKWVVFPWERYE